MVPRLRSKARAGWPDNLYTSGRGGFKYRHPVTGGETWMGADRAKAFAAAKKLNALLAPTNDLVARVIGTGETVADAVRVFRADDMPKRNWSPRTAKWYEVFLNRIVEDLGARPLAEMTVRDCATYLRDVSESPRSRQTYRLVLGWVLACAVEEGWIDINLADQTRKFSHTRKRARLTLDAYKAIRDAAPVWLQNAMDVSLITLLRREDVSALRFSDAHDDALWVVPIKTSTTTGTRLRIALTDELQSLISRCRDDVVSPFVVHRLPEKARPSNKRAADRTHHTQVLPTQLSRAFAQARKDAGIDIDNPPTFHEIRSLGGALLREKGWNVEQVQALMGHASPEMTQGYLGGHEVPWTQVSPGLSVNG